MRTPTPSQYPVLENRPIDQWKVTELKEELKRRRLKTGGLKDDLIRRLDDALRAEMEVAAVETNVVGGNDNGVGYSAPEKVVDSGAPGIVDVQSVFRAGDSGAVGFGNTEGMVGNADEVMGNAEEVMGNAEEVMGSMVDFVGDAAKKDEGTADANVFQVEVDVKDSGEHIGKDESVNEQQSGLVNDPLSGVGVMAATDVASVVMGDEVSDGFFSEKTAGGESVLEGKTERDNGVSGEQQHSEDILPAHEDVKLDTSDQNNQVSEVSTSLGFPVKSNNSVSTDSLSINEKNDLKDDLIADNVKLESDVKPEMVQPSSSDIVPDGGASHPSDVDKPHDNKVSVEETENTDANADMSQKNCSADLASEKLNLDRSSGDDSMEEDALESKQIDSKYNSEDVGAKTEKNEVAPGKAESLVATTMDTDLPPENKVIDDQKIDAAILPDKRKLSDEEVALNNKPAKRQHRWKTETKNVTEPQISPIPPPASAEDLPQSAALRRSFSRSDSIGANDPPKEREVPPSSKPATNSLRIDRFLRPFTLKAVQELLGKTGTVASFWMDHIKTHCYVTYSSVEEAEETRNAVYNLQWPPNGGRQLLAEFVEPEEVKLRLEPPPPPAAPENSAPPKASEPPTIPQPSPRQQSLRQQLVQQPTLPPPPPNQAPVREWAAPPPPPPIEKVDAPIVTLDDLFRKTKATPRIYYLPLTDEQVTARHGNSKQ